MQVSCDSNTKSNREDGGTKSDTAEHQAEAPLDAAFGSRKNISIK